MFFQKKMKDQPGGINEVNMTPLIDVSLVLVVMLMLTTPLAFESSIGVRKSSKSAVAPEKPNPIERIELNIVSDDSVRVNRMMVARGDLVETLRPLIEASVDGTVIIACDGKVAHGAFVNVLDQTKICGASKIAITGK